MERDLRTPGHSQATAASDEGAASISHIAMKLPEFTAADPEMWFALLERTFCANRISSDSTKFNHASSAIPLRYAQEIRDIIIKPPASGQYETLKKELIRRLSTTREQKIRQLLERESIGDRKPSQFLRHLRNLAEGNASEELLKTLWMTRLPHSVQVVITSQDDQPLDKIAELADRVFDLTKSSVAQVAAASAPSWEDALNARMTQLTLQLREEIAATVRSEIAALNRSTVREHTEDSRRRSRSKSRSQSVARHGSDGVCYFHWRFGSNAKRCHAPCTYSDRRPEQSLATTSDANLKPRRLFITDRTTHTQFLVDTGADVSVYPRKLTSNRRQKSSSHTLHAANGSSISTYGQVSLSLDLGLRRDFRWRFMVADVDKPTLGADFLRHFDLLVDMRRQQLLDRTTQLTTSCRAQGATTTSIGTIHEESTHARTRAERPELTRTTNIRHMKVMDNSAADAPSRPQPIAAMPTTDPASTTTIDSNATDASRGTQSVPTTPTNDTPPRNNGRFKARHTRCNRASSATHCPKTPGNAEPGSTQATRLDRSSAQRHAVPTAVPATTALACTNELDYTRLQERHQPSTTCSRQQPERLHIATPQQPHSVTRSGRRVRFADQHQVDS